MSDCIGFAKGIDLYNMTVRELVPDKPNMVKHLQVVLRASLRFPIGKLISTEMEGTKGFVSSDSYSVRNSDFRHFMTQMTEFTSARIEFYLVEMPDNIGLIGFPNCKQLKIRHCTNEKAILWSTCKQLHTLEIGKFSFDQVPFNLINEVPDLQACKVKVEQTDFSQLLSLLIEHPCKAKQLLEV